MCERESQGAFHSGPKINFVEQFLGFPRIKFLQFAKHSTEKFGYSGNKFDFTVPKDPTITPNDEEKRTEKG